MRLKWPCFDTSCAPVVGVNSTPSTNCKNVKTSRSVWGSVTERLHTSVFALVARGSFFGSLEPAITTSLVCACYIFHLMWKIAYTFFNKNIRTKGLVVFTWHLLSFWFGQLWTIRLTNGTVLQWSQFILRCVLITRQTPSVWRVCHTVECYYTTPDLPTTIFKQ